MSVPHLDLSVPINSIENSSQRVRKGPVLDQNRQRLERLIVDSTKRRTRIQRDGEIGGNNYINEIGNKEIATVSSNQLDELASHDNAASEKHDINDDHQYSDIQDKMSNFAITSNGSRFNKEVLFNQTVTIGTKRKSDQRKTAPTVNYLDRNKKQVVEIKNKDLLVSSLDKNQKSWHMQLRNDKGSILSANGPPAKVAKAKINSNLRSSSASGVKRGVTKSPTQKAKEVKVVLGLTASERIKQDLKKMNTEEMKVNIKNHINSKYSEIEDILNANMAVGQPMRNIDEIGGETINSQTNLSTLDQKPPISALKNQTKITRPVNFEFATAKRNTQRIADSKTSLSSNNQKNKIVKGGIPTVPTQNIDLQSRPTQSSKTKGGARVTISSGPVKLSVSVQEVKQHAETSRQVETQKMVVNKLWGQRNSIQKPLQQPFIRAKDAEYVDREEPRSVKNIPEPEKKESKVGNSSKRSSSVQQNSNFYMPRRRKLSNPQIQLSNNTPSSDFKPSPAEITKDGDATNGGMESSKTFKYAQQVEEWSDLNGSNPALIQSESRSIKGKTFNSTTGINLKSKEDVMNFDIENIWKEMEEIGRSKKAAHELFQAFQDQYSDSVEASQYYDQSVESPTRRLIHMKNATTKHHVIEYRKGITGRYAIQYTTCPEKSYVILPHDGQTDYDQFNDKNAHKMVSKIINATVERVELKESGKRLKSNPNSRKVTNKSPVRINREYCHRGELIGGTFNTNGNNLADVEEAKQCANSDDEIDQNSQDKPDIESKDQAVSRGVIFEENQNDVEEISFHEDSIINICSNGMNSEGHRSVIVVEDCRNVGVTPIPTSCTQVPISQELLTNNENGAPFHSDEHSINQDDQSIISAAQKEVIQQFENAVDANYYANNGIPDVEEVIDVQVEKQAEASDEEIPYANLQEEDQKVQLEAINEEEVKQSLVPITEAGEDEEQKGETPSDEKVNEQAEISSPENNGMSQTTPNEKRSGRRKGGKRRRY